MAAHVSRPKQVVVLTADAELQRRIAEALAPSPGYHLLQRTTNLEDLYSLGVQGIVNVILIDQRLSPDDPVALVRPLRDRLPDVPLAVLARPDDTEYIRRALLAGAKAFLPLEFTPSSLTQTIDDLSADGLQIGRRGREGRVAAVFSIKGGVGRTLIATNLAVALRAETRGPVVLVDGQLVYGDVQIDMNLKPQHTIADVIRQVDTLEPEVLDVALARHASGVRVLAASENPDLLQRIRPGHLAAIIQALRSQYPWIVIDTGNWMDENVDAVLDASDVVLLVTTPEMTALRAARVFLQTAREQGYDQGKVRLVLNRSDLLGGIPERQIERNLGMAVFASLSDDSALVTYSINRGVPLVQSHPRKRLARVIRMMAEELLAEARPQPGTAQRAPGLLGRLRGAT